MATFVYFDCTPEQFLELVGTLAMGAPISAKKGYHEGTTEFVSQTWRMGHEGSGAYFEGPEVFILYLRTLGYNTKELPF